MPKKLEYTKGQEIGDQCYYQYDVTPDNPRKGRIAVFQCRCGNTFTALIHSVKSLNKKSCGCLPTCCAPTHGGWGSRLYSIWNGMKDRCYNSNSDSYTNYGGKGVLVTPEWHDFADFKKWAYANGYSEELTLDRINVAGNYSPENCRWTNWFTQAQNRGMNKNNTSGYKGVSICNNTGKYKASIGYNKKQITLGRFSTAKDAALAYNNFVTTYSTGHTLNEIL